VLPYYGGTGGEVPTTFLLVVSILAVTGDLMVSYLHSAGIRFSVHISRACRQNWMYSFTGCKTVHTIRFFLSSARFSWLFLIIALLSNFYVVSKFMELLYHCKSMKKR